MPCSAKSAIRRSSRSASSLTTVFQNVVARMMPATLAGASVSRAWARRCLGGEEGAGEVPVAGVGTLAGHEAPPFGTPEVDAAGAGTGDEAQVLLNALRADAADALRGDLALILALPGLGLELRHP